jgi:hypothetical protein
MTVPLEFARWKAPARRQAVQPRARHHSTVSRNTSRSDLQMGRLT